MLDSQVLAEGNPDEDLKAWQARLKRARILGRVEKVQAQSAGASTLSEVLEALSLGPQRERPPWRPLREQWAIALGTVVVGLGLLANGSHFSALSIFTAGTALCLAAESVRPDSPPAADRAWQRAMAERVRRLSRSTFIEDVGGVVVESSPYFQVLRQRQRDLDLGVKTCETRLEEVQRLRSAIVDANRRLGRPEEDPEVEALDLRLQALRDEQQRLLQLQSRLDQITRSYDARLQQLRDHVRRQALSRRVGKVLGPEAPAAQLPVTAELEVDLHSLEDEFRGLGVALSNADARLRAVLEIEAVSRR